MRFEPLTRCDVDGCDVLIEPHVLRCDDHERKHGRHPMASGPRGASPRPEPTVASRKREARSGGDGWPPRDFWLQRGFEPCETDGCSALVDPGLFTVCRRCHRRRGRR